MCGSTGFLEPSASTHTFLRRLSGRSPQVRQLLRGVLRSLCVSDLFFCHIISPRDFIYLFTLFTPQFFNVWFNRNFLLPWYWVASLQVQLILTSFPQQTPLSFVVLCPVFQQRRSVGHPSDPVASRSILLPRTHSALFAEHQPIPSVSIFGLFGGGGDMIDDGMGLSNNLRVVSGFN